MSFEAVENFEKEIAKFFGAPEAIAVDCCTHAIELCLRHEKVKEIIVPKRTYVSIPFLADKLNISLKWKDEEWVDFYFLSDKIVDAAVLWEKDIATVGYHYYMTPETAQRGLDKLPDAIEAKPKQWSIIDWPDLTKMEVFK